MSEQNKIQRIDSKTSIGFPETEEKTNEKKRTDIKEREELVTNVCQLVIHCEQHHKICISKVSSKGLWLPSMSMQYNDSWIITANELLQKIGIESNGVKIFTANLINIFRIQMTQTSSFVTRITYLVIIPKEVKFKCCSDNDKYKWISVKTVIKSECDFFWGPEVKIWTQFWIQKQNIKTSKQRNEYDIRDALRDYCDNQSNSCATNQQMTIRSACFTEKDILRVYDLFVQHCFPSQFMTFTSFKLFIRKIGLKISENNMFYTFRAFDCQKRSYLNFNELLLGLAAMDQATQHGGQSGQIRCHYLMRYYDSDSDDFLSHSDMCHMITDIQKLPDSPHKNSYDSTKSSVEEYATQVIKANGTDDRISLTQLTKAIGDLKFRGTSGLFRASGSVLKHIMKLMTEEKSNLLSVSLVKDNKYQSVCQKCRKRRYLVSKRVYKMSKNGEVLTFIDLSKTYTKIAFASVSDFPETQTFHLTLEVINKLHEIKKLRFDSVNTSGEGNGLLTNWLYPSKQTLIDKLMTICEKCKAMFEKEDRILRIPTPCYIFGDIHGNFKDLMIFANDFWRSSPLLSECHFLFLGDYVDRGLFGVECVIYLFALKLMAPKNFWMCRGNHEVRSLQESFTFKNECLEKYSIELWDAINETFDRLPVAAVVDNKLFCSHGGIPTSTNSIEVLGMAPNVLDDPVNQSAPVWEVLWNDPMTDEEFRQLSSFDKKDLEEMKGFRSNLKRGTAFYYSEEAVDRFFTYNNIQYIIRGHECMATGYKFLMNAKVMTIFSTSLYAGLRNEAAVLFVNQNKIRVLRVHTFE